MNKATLLCTECKRLFTISTQGDDFMELVCERIHEDGTFCHECERKKAMHIANRMWRQFADNLNVTFH